MHEGLSVDFGGEHLQLLGGRALYWPAQASLVIADLHLGKGDVFRDAGLAVPSGGTTADLSRLGDLLDATAAGTLYVLGDMLHGATSGTRWRAQWEAWREPRAALRIVAIPGNHDRHLAAAGLALELAADTLQVGALRLSHAPASGVTPLLCGHLHPVVRLPRIPGRHAAFVIAPGRLILPAFSDFTGGHEWTAQPQERLYVCTPDRVVALPPGTPVRARRG